MPQRLRVLAGTSATTMVPVTELVNTGNAHPLVSELFDGALVAYIKGFDGGRTMDGNGNEEGEEVDDPEYFARPDRQNVTWSIQVQGRFLVPYTADDILFGNTFDRPLKLPWGTSAALKFMHYVDPTLEHDLQSQNKPWALSPLIATMPYFMHTRVCEQKGRSRTPSFASSVTDASSESGHEHVEQDHKHELDSKTNDENNMLKPPQSSRTKAHNLDEKRHPYPHLPSVAPPFPLPAPQSIAENTSQLWLTLPDTLSSAGSASSSSSSLSGGGSRPPSPGSSSSSVASTHTSASAGKSNTSKSSFGIRNAMRRAVGKETGVANASASGEVTNASSSGKSLRSKLGRKSRKIHEMNFETSAQRRAYFHETENRKKIVFGPQDIITTDFCYGFMRFRPSLSLNLPGGLSFDISRYWDGQPVRFVCCARKGANGILEDEDVKVHVDNQGQDGSDDNDEVPWGKIFWCVCIELVDDHHESE